jgi:phosphoribosylaminoimidazolecarboxamide formyltransferase/IMP cyclohydrolase
MGDLKKMYTTIVDDPFPTELVIRLGETELAFAKRSWTIDGQHKGLRYGENPDQPAALYAPVSGRLSLGGVEFRGPGDGLVCAATEEHLLQSGKHPGKTNLTDVDNGVNILQYLTAKPGGGHPQAQQSLRRGLVRPRPGNRVHGRLRRRPHRRFRRCGGDQPTMDVATAKRINAVYMESWPPRTTSPRRWHPKSKRICAFSSCRAWPSSTSSGQPFLDFSPWPTAVWCSSSPSATASLARRLFARRSHGQGRHHRGGPAPTAREAEDLAVAWAVKPVSSNSVISPAKAPPWPSAPVSRTGRVVELTIHKGKTK